MIISPASPEHHSSAKTEKTNKASTALHRPQASRGATVLRRYSEARVMSSRWTWSSSSTARCSLSSASTAAPQQESHIRPQTTGGGARVARRERPASSIASSSSSRIVGQPPQQSKEQKALELMKEMNYEHARHVAAQKAASRIAEAEARARSSSPPKLQADGQPIVPPLKLTSPAYETEKPRWGLRSQFTYAQWKAFKKREADEKEVHEAAAARALAKQRQAKLAIQKEAEAAARAQAQELMDAEAKAAAWAAGEGRGDEGTLATDGRLAGCVDLSCLNPLSPGKQDGASQDGTSQDGLFAGELFVGGKAAGGKNLPQAEAAEGYSRTVLDGSPPPKQMQREVCVHAWCMRGACVVVGAHARLRASCEAVSILLAVLSLPFLTSHLSPLTSHLSPRPLVTSSPLQDPLPALDAEERVELEHRWPQRNTGRNTGRNTLGYTSSSRPSGRLNYPSYRDAAQANGIGGNLARVYSSRSAQAAAAVAELRAASPGGEGAPPVPSPI